MFQTMKKDIELLEKIQILDREIYANKLLIEELPEELTALDRELEAEKRTLKSIEEELKGLQLKQKQKESELQDKENNIKKLDGQLAMLKTNKEYAAMQQEIKSLKADNSILEEAILESFDLVSNCQQKLKTEQVRLQEIEAKTKEKKRVIEEKSKGLKARAEELEQQKKDFIKEVNPDMALLYEKIVRNKQGLALVKVETESCPACQLQLRPQQLNEIKLGENVVLCEQCSRILY